MHVDEARKLVDESGVEFKAITDKIDEKIREAAKKGLRIFDVGSIYGLNISICEPTYMINCKSEEKDLVDKLILFYKQNGFHAIWRTNGLPYVPRAYEDDDNPQNHINWSLFIEW